MTVTLIICGIILCIAFSAFFSASEMALSSSNKIRLENEAESGNKKAQKALSLTSNFDHALSTILIGNNLVNIAASTLASVLVILLTGEDTLTWIATTIITILVIIFGESIPKISAKKNANRFSLFASPFIYMLSIILKPLVYVVVKLVHFITRAIKPESSDSEDEELKELQSIIETAEDEGVLDEDQSELLKAAIEFKEISAQEVMTARVDVEAIDIDDSVFAITQQLEGFSHTRIPVFEDSIDNIIGILHLNTFFKALTDKKEVDLRSLLLPPVFVYKTMKLPTILSHLKKAKQHIAVVTDEYSGTLGVVTFEDVLEEIVGEIWDESDEIETEVYQTNQNTYIIDGDMPIDDFIELLKISASDFEYDSETVGGWVIEMLEHFPEELESFEYEGLTITVIEAEERRVVSVRVEK